MEKLIGIKVNKIINIIKVNKNTNPININTPKIKDENVPSLPKDFFETVLDCEVKLKEKFNIKIFQKLANYYSAAVAYYESINDPKYMIYNQSLSLLFSQTEAKKYLSDGAIKQKFKKDKIKKKMQDCDTKNISTKVKNFIKRKGTVDKNVITNLINKDINIQQNDFKKRLAEKKKRYKLSISDNEVNNDVGKVFKKIGINSINLTDNNESFDFISEKEFKFSEKDISSLNSLTNNTFTDKNSNSNNDNSANNIQIVINNNNVLDQLKYEDIKNGDENNSKEEKNINNILTDISFENKLDNNSENSKKSSKLCNIKFTNKTLFLEKMKFNFDIYSNDYYDYFIKKISDQIIKDYNNNYNELTITLTDIVVNSLNQQKELEYLINSDSDDMYKKEINNIIQQLKDEEKNSTDNLILENKDKIGKLNDKYLGPINTFQSDHDIEMVKERLKLDITKSLNNFVFK